MKTLKLHEKDNVTVAIKAIDANEPVDGEHIQAAQPIAAGHKVAINSIKKGENVLKYGQIIGEAKEDIAPGEHVHTHNLGVGSYRPSHPQDPLTNTTPATSFSASFMGYHRSQERVGTRNYIGILTSVNCAGSVAQFIAEEAERRHIIDDFENIDGIVPLVHGTGCGMSSSGEGYETLHRTLAGYAQNPNFGAILLVGLGCEVMQVSALIGSYKQEDQARFRYMTIQESGGTRQTVERGIEFVEALAEIANTDTRKEAPASALTLGMQCGGSDGYSGLSANPALGVASDLLVQCGGTSLLSETSEIYGAEHLLTRRAVTPDVSQKLMQRIHWWEDYCARNHGEMDNNPSPGNKLGGLTTILEKSLGAVAKAGSAPLSDVILYGEQTRSKGLIFMDSPGYDPCSVTGQVASGANLIAFTTGRGSVSGYKPTPCLKLASNSAMYKRLSEDMDLNCGDIIEGTCTIEEKGRVLFELMLKIASGTPTKSEELGFGGVEFVPWQIGAVM